jgi:hypothetical protein
MEVNAVLMLFKFQAAIFPGKFLPEISPLPQVLPERIIFLNLPEK